MKKTDSCFIWSVLMTIRKSLVLFSTALIALTLLLPFNALIAENGTAYNANDIQKLAAFLEIEDESGVKNGAKLNSAYDPSLIETWCAAGEAQSGSMELPPILWREDGGELRLVRLALPFMHDFRGKLDLSGCAALEYLCFRDNRISELNVSGCSALTTLICYRNELTSLDVSPCPKLETLAFQHNAVTSIDVSKNPLLGALYCDGNGIASLDLSGNPALTELRCEGNALSELELGHNSQLSRLWTSGNPLKSLDLSRNPELKLSGLFASGDGSIGYYGSENMQSVFAERHGGSEFVGWFDASGKCVSTAQTLRLDASSPAELIAVFASQGSTPASPAERSSGALSPLQIILPTALAGAAAAAILSLMAKRTNKNSDKN